MHHVHSDAGENQGALDPRGLELQADANHLMRVLGTKPRFFTKSSTFWLPLLSISPAPVHFFFFGFSKAVFLTGTRRECVDW